MKITIEPYDPQWKVKFQDYKQAILTALGDVAVEHIGSTSVEGLRAKPIIDIQVGVNDANTLNGLIPQMIKAGFTYMLKYEHLLPMRRYFVLYKSADGNAPPQILDVNDNLPVGFTNVAHIHCWVKESEDYMRHLAFRDYLRSHDEERQSYQSLKMVLSEREWKSSLEYSQAKNDFIKEMERKAIDWYQTR